MLSYQHIYHAGGPADLHKHSVLVMVLEALCSRHRALTYMETHAGRGRYDLASEEARKTDEAAAGWLDKALAAKVPARLRNVVLDINDGQSGTLYPGSPLIAQRMLRKSDQLHLFELHPNEYNSLRIVFEGCENVTVSQYNGYEGVMDLSPPLPRRGLVLIDPSYEIKDEYEELGPYVQRLIRRWPEAEVLIWYPLLPAGRHEAMKSGLAALVDGCRVHEYCWTDAAGVTGMYGSGMILVNSTLLMDGFLPLV